MVKSSSVENLYGHGRRWLRGEIIGKGSFGSVYLATLKKPNRRATQFFPVVMAAKSAEISDSSSLQKERMVLNSLGNCPFIRQCYGEEITNTGDQMVYNLLLEYGSGGTLGELIKKKGRTGLPEQDVKSYTKSILLGIQYTHVHGYVHRDLEPKNIVLVPCSTTSNSRYIAKISDYGSAKMVKTIKKRRLLAPYLRGKIKYLSPDAVTMEMQEQACDIWALGCIVVEMLTGKSIWEGKTDLEIGSILSEIGKGCGGGNISAVIPSWISEEAKDFLKGCFTTKAENRLTAEKLLLKPFVAGILDDTWSVEGSRLVLGSDDVKLIHTNIVYKSNASSSSLPSIIFAGA